MNKDTNILKKTVKVAGVTCLALGGVALIASGAALKALTEGAKYLKDTVKKIIDDKPVEEPAIVEEAEEMPSVETAAETTVVVDTSANE
ncbi:MAG: hypothetical protein J6C98_06680 [Oscillospiraceae bacterium]|nr:hypothetical protein [Oscillospiraceae bacterium]